MRLLLIVVFVLASVGSAAAQSAAAARGKAVFTEQKCKLCHSIEGVGNKNGSLDGIGSTLSADEIRQWILTPTEMAAKAKATRKPPMKAFSNLSKADLDALVTYLSGLKKK